MLISTTCCFLSLKMLCNKVVALLLLAFPIAEAHGLKQIWILTKRVSTTPWKYSSVTLHNQTKPNHFSSSLPAHSLYTHWAFFILIRQLSSESKLWNGSYEALRGEWYTSAIPLKIEILLSIVPQTMNFLVLVVDGEKLSWQKALYTHN